MTLLNDLAGIAGPEHVLTDPDVVAGYTVDWTRRFSGVARCVVRPGSAPEVAAVVAACARAGVPLIPQGGNTSLVGGSVPRDHHVGGGHPPTSGAAGHRDLGHGGPGASPGMALPQATPCPPAPTPRPPEVVLSTRRLTRLDPVDTVAGQVTAGAGVTIATLHEHARAAGMQYGVDLASRDTATVGGTIATNAGGIRTIRYGHTRAQIVGVEAVLADGTVMSRLSGLVADNTGYDLAGLMVGSEGTLAVVTAARLRLWPAEPVVTTVLTGVADVAAAIGLCAEIRARVPGLRAAEYIEADGVALVREVAGLPAPLPRDYPAYLLAEISGVDDHTERLAEITQLADAAVAVDGPDRASLWAYRERHTEAISAAGIAHKLDVAMPLDRLAGFRAALPAILEGHRPIVFGHIGVGNLHVNVLGPKPDDDRVDEAVLRLVAGHGGTISAEHGVGVAKASLLHLSRSPAEITMMRRIKVALDPDGVLNPGVLL